MRFSNNSPFALGWSQLSFGKSKMMVAVFGVCAISALILSVLSLKDAVVDSTLQIPKSLKSDVIILSARTQSILRPAPFSRRLLDRVRGIEGVAATTFVTIENGQWINPDTHQEHPIRVLGLELEFDVIDLPGIDPQEPRLHMKDQLIFDASSRPKFGNVATTFRAEKNFTTELNGRRIEVCGLTYSGVSIAADGNVFTTHANFQRLFPHVGNSRCHIGVLKLHSPLSATDIAAQVQTLLGKEVHVMTRAQMVAAERSFMILNDPVDDIMGMIAAISFFVGMIIVYQILYTDVVNHLPQFATLKAMGFSSFFLLRIILSEGLILSILGFWPGLLLAFGLAHLSEQATLLPVSISNGNIIFVFATAMLMCTFAALMSIRKITAIEPASVF